MVTPSLSDEQKDALRRAWRALYNISTMPPITIKPGEWGTPQEIKFPVVFNPIPKVMDARLVINPMESGYLDELRSIYDRSIYKDVHRVYRMSFTLVIIDRKNQKLIIMSFGSKRLEYKP